MTTRNLISVATVILITGCSGRSGTLKGGGGRDGAAADTSTGGSVDTGSFLDGGAFGTGGTGAGGTVSGSGGGLGAGGTGGGVTGLGGGGGSDLEIGAGGGGSGGTAVGNGGSGSGGTVAGSGGSKGGGVDSGLSPCFEEDHAIASFKACTATSDCKLATIPTCCAGPRPIVGLARNANCSIPATTCDPSCSFVPWGLTEDGKTVTPSNAGVRCVSDLCQSFGP